MFSAALPFVSFSASIATLVLIHVGYNLVWRRSWELVARPGPLINAGGEIFTVFLILAAAVFQVDDLFPVSRLQETCLQL